MSASLRDRVAKRRAVRGRTVSREVLRRQIEEIIHAIANEARNGLNRQVANSFNSRTSLRTT